MIGDALAWILGAAVVISGVFVVASRDLVHAVLWLALALLCTAGLYAYLDAPFLAGVQVLTYVGGVATLMVFGVMVTRRHAAAAAEAGNDSNVVGAVVALGVFAVLAIAILKTDLPTSTAPTPDTAELGRTLLDDYLLAFEAVSLLLLAAVVGAVVIARRRDVEARTQDDATLLPTMRTGAD
ncbi:MAG: NADH-quinone oxidoreductase subunit J [Planctomycetes bacterium]|nr:NADH-quinone oxidoreductase subunit J [Planctomycetota bacterium]